MRSRISREVEDRGRKKKDITRSLITHVSFEIVDGDPLRRFDLTQRYTNRHGQSHDTLYNNRKEE